MLIRVCQERLPTACVLIQNKSYNNNNNNNNNNDNNNKNK